MDIQSIASGNIFGTVGQEVAIKTTAGLCYVCREVVARLGRPRGVSWQVAFNFYNDLHIFNQVG